MHSCATYQAGSVSALHWPTGRAEPVFHVSAQFPNATAGMNANEGFGSESRFQALFDQAPTSMQLLRADGTTIQVNRAWRLLWEMPDGSALSDYVLSGAYNVLTDPQLCEKGVIPYLERAFAGESVKIPVAKYDTALLGKPGRIKGGEPADKNTEASIAIPFGGSTMIGRLACSRMPWRTLLSTPNVINTEATPLKKTPALSRRFQILASCAQGATDRRLTVDPPSRECAQRLLR
jgi:hypothetical protein